MEDCIEGLLEDVGPLFAALMRNEELGRLVGQTLMDTFDELH